MLSGLNSFTPLKRDRSLGHAGNEQTKSSERDIFRYSYNLGKQRTKQLQRAASLAANIGGGITQKNEEDDGFAKESTRRRTLPRSMSMESEPALNYDKTRGDSIREEVLRSRVLDTRVALVEVSRESEKTNALDVKPDTIENDNQVEKPEHNIALDSDENQKNETRNKSSDNARPKSGSLSESVPDLRNISSAENTNCEDFPSFLSPESTEKAQSRPICKLRRAARRLGVSLSSEELYHKQRRNGLCTEIDDAADNRKLLRVLNKRF